MRAFLLVLAVLAAPSTFAQNALSDLEAPENTVREAVAALFDGMRAGDSAAVRAAFHPQARLMNVINEKDSYRLAQTDLTRFLRSVADAPVVYDERVGEIEVRTDDGLATAWMPYRFYAGDEFSHCGVNAMQLVLDEPIGEGIVPRWRIVEVIDTRRGTCQ